MRRVEFHMMKRRELVSRRGGLRGRSPSPRSSAAIGFLKAHRRVHSYFVAAFHGLREMDEVEDHNVAIEYRCVEGQNDRFRRSRRKLVFRAT
jgi:hypothetical protein